MENIELVIKIPKDTYDVIKNGYMVFGVRSSEKILSIIYDAVANGTPLPKGHGRIDDIDKILDEMRATKTYDIPFVLERIKPIIEADKSEE